MTTKLSGMVTYYEFLLTTQSCDLSILMWHFDLLVTWQIKLTNQSAEFVKGTFPEISNTFEFTRKHFVFFLKAVRLDTYDELLLCSQSFDLLIHVSNKNVIFSVKKLYDH